VACISLLAWHFPQRGIILKATIIVCVFKMMLSPHSPATAYIAVLFQGLAGELLFLNRKYFRISCLLLAVIALVESAIQRLLVLTILYGTQLWEAVNIFLSRLSGESSPTSYSWYFAAGYVLLHLVVGIFVGRFIATLPARLIKTNAFDNEKDTVSGTAVSKKRKGFLRPALLLSSHYCLFIYNLLSRSGALCCRLLCRCRSWFALSSSSCSGILCCHPCSPPG
jgi:ABC-type thiamin/hydroxymethylpyrimidine transport system permease subunit